MDFITAITNVDGISLEKEQDIIFVNRNENIVKIDSKNKSYKKIKEQGYEDIYRILDWFNFEDENKKNETTKCSPLGCIGCSGCSFGNLSLIYNSKKTLKKYLPEIIVDEYIFIGKMEFSKDIYNPSPYKKYIGLSENGFIEYSLDENRDIKVKKCIDDIIINNLYIDEYIPEILCAKDEKSYKNKLYGIYNGNAVVWRKVFLEGRYVFKEKVIC
ncbi:MAG: hypothetical protein ACERKV_01205 [Clostridiaceae bacterium]